MERALLIGVSFGLSDRARIQSRLTELAQLARTAGAEVIQTFTQDRHRPDPHFYVGSGLVERIRLFVEGHQIELAIVWNDVSPAAERNLEAALGIKVVNRTELILDIFAQHARTKEGALQVEMAQATYLLSRLVGKGMQMSRLGGGIGTRGPGETKLEMDRRRLRRRIAELRRDLARLVHERQVQRDLRKRSALPVVAIVGYTNAGKSTLLRTLTKANVFVQDKLFSTLDPTVRRLRLPEGGEVLLIDTVGFVENLPEELISAFRATLEEVRFADLLLHVVDLSDPSIEWRMEAVRGILDEIGAAAKPVVTLFNKIDLLKKRPSQRWKEKHRPAIFCSLMLGKGIPELLQVISQWTRQRLKKIRLRIPFSESRLISEIYRVGQLIRQEAREGVHVIEAYLPPESIGQVSGYRIRKMGR